MEISCPPEATLQKYLSTLLIFLFHSLSVNGVSSDGSAIIGPTAECLVLLAERMHLSLTSCRAPRVISATLSSAWGGFYVAIPSGVGSPEQDILLETLISLSIISGGMVVVMGGG